MQLYDNQSSIDWHELGMMTYEQMQEVPQLGQLLTEPSVLFDDGEGKVYTWLLLSVMCGKYHVEMTGDEDADYAALLAAMERPRLTPDQELQAQLDALAGVSG